MTLTTIINTITGIAQAIIPILVSLAFLFFLWGLASFILSAGDAEKQKVGKDRMLWGGVALFFIVSIGGLLAILSQTFFPTSFRSTPSGFPANQFPADFEPGNLPVDGLHDGAANDDLLNPNPTPAPNAGSADQGSRFRSFACFFGNCDPDEREGFPRTR